MTRFVLSEEMIAQAAELAHEKWLASLPEPEDCEHEFPEGYYDAIVREGKKRQSRQTALRRIAVIFIAILLGSAILYAVNPDARAVVKGWFREIFREVVVYRFEENTDLIRLPQYSLSFLPEGFEMVDDVQSEISRTVVYADENMDNVIVLQYFLFTENGQIELHEGTEAKHESIMINDLRGEFYYADDESNTNNLVWFDDTKKVAFVLDSNLDKCVMLKIAEGIGIYQEHAVYPLIAMNILQELGAQNPTIIPKDRTSGLGDNLVKNPATAITFNGTSYAFLNDEGEIIRIKRVKELRTKKTNNAFESNFKNTDSLKDYIEHNLVRSEYVLVNEYYFSKETLSLRYERILFPGALDRYDYISVRIDTSLSELETFYKAESGFQLEKDKDIISEEEAIEIAKNLWKTDETIIEARLAIVKTNNYFNNSATENELRLAYMISTAESIVYVDAYTAEIVGGDAYKELYTQAQ